MAERSRKSTTKKTTNKANTASSGSGNRSSRQRKSTSVNIHTEKEKTTIDQSEAEVGSEITVVVCLAVCILMMLSTVNLCGGLGRTIAYILFGIFGLLAYPLPIFLFFLVCFCVVNRRHRLVKIKAASIILFYMIMCVLVHLIQIPRDLDRSLMQVVELCATGRYGGGLIGELILKAIYPLVGRVGSFVVLFAALLICFSLATRKRVLIDLGKKSRNAYKQGATQRKIKREQRTKAREEAITKENANRIQTKFRDKDLNFDLTKGVLKSDDERKKEKDSISNEITGRHSERKKIQKKPIVPDTSEIEEEWISPEESHRQSPFNEETMSKGRRHKKTTDGIKSVDQDESVSEQKREVPVGNTILKQQSDDLKTNQDINRDLNEKDIMPVLRKQSVKNVSKNNYQSPMTAEAFRNDIEKDYPDLFETIPITRMEQVVRDENSLTTTDLKINSRAEKNSEETEEYSISEINSEKSTLKSHIEKIDDLLLAAKMDEQNGIIEDNHLKKENDFDAAAIDTDIFSETKKTAVASDFKNQVSESVTPTESAARKAAAKAEAMKQTELSEEDKQATAEVIETALEQKKEYVFPPVSLLTPGEGDKNGVSDTELRKTAHKLQETLESFGVGVTVNNVSCGPSVTRYELTPDVGVKVSRITNLADDIKLNLAVADIRIEAPIPGKSAIGIEVPNKENVMVTLRELIDSREFSNVQSGIQFTVGRDIGGRLILADISKMPHLLIAGSTGSGKSVCINTLIMSIIYKYKPDDVRMIMIDPKVVELSVYNGIPHLLIPVVTDPKKAAGALNWAVMEMTDRYKKFADLNVRDLKGYNAKVRSVAPENTDYPELPQIVIIIDELADLMMVASNEVEDAICRLAQLARACGIHLVIATQRPSVNVITGLIKANIPSRIAFAVSSSVDSRTIIDMGGAEKLLGKGDMLFYPSGYQKPLRVQGAFVSDKEVNDVVEFLKESQDNEVNYNTTITDQIANGAIPGGGQIGASDQDEYFVDAGRYIIEKDKASIGMLQRVFRIGFNRAARIMDQLYEAGVVGPEEGTKPRKVLMVMEEFENYIENM